MVKTLRVKRSRLSLPDLGRQGSPENFIRVIEDQHGIDLESATLEDQPVEVDKKTGRRVRRTTILRDVKPDPNDKDYVICSIEEVTSVVER